MHRPIEKTNRRVFFAVGAAALSKPLLAETPPVASPAPLVAPGEPPVRFGRNQYVEYLAGELPVIVSAPHGGRLKPDELPNRTKGTFAFDVGTQELARAIADEFHGRTGRHLHLVICRLHRSKIDCNREIVEAAAGHPLAEQAWREYQGFLTAARESVERKHGRGLFIDLHGHGHPAQRLEIGYLHDAKTLQRDDQELDKPEVVAAGSLRTIAARGQMPYSQLLRGPLGFGALMERNGFPATPSPTTPRPPEPYFRGGYNTARTLAETPSLASLQIETHYKTVRDNRESRAKFAKAIYAALETYLASHLGLRF